LLAMTYGIIRATTLDDKPIGENINYNRYELPKELERKNAEIEEYNGGV